MLSRYLIPLIVFVIIMYGFIKKCDLYSTFVEGAIDGLRTVIDILPVLLAMIFAVNIFVGSGLLDIIGGKFKEIIPMIILRPISGNASLAMLSKIYHSSAMHIAITFL